MRHTHEDLNGQKRRVCGSCGSAQRDTHTPLISIRACVCLSRHDLTNCNTHTASTPI
jgi:hypothetical protein